MHSSKCKAIPYITGHWKQVPGVFMNNVDQTKCDFSGTIADCPGFSQENRESCPVRCIFVEMCKHCDPELSDMYLVVYVFVCGWYIQVIAQVITVKIAQTYSCCSNSKPHCLPTAEVRTQLTSAIWSVLGFSTVHGKASRSLYM